MKSPNYKIENIFRPNQYLLYTYSHLATFASSLFYFVFKHSIVYPKKLNKVPIIKVNFYF